MQEMVERAPRSEWIEGRQAMQTPEDVQAMLKLASLSGCADFERSHADSRYDCDRNGNRGERTACLKRPPSATSKPSGILTSTAVAPPCTHGPQTLNRRLFPLPCHQPGSCGASSRRSGVRSVWQATAGRQTGVAERCELRSIHAEHRTSRPRRLLGDVVWALCGHGTAVRSGGSAAERPRALGEGRQ